jgi:hypothetical protein
MHVGFGAQEEAPVGIERELSKSRDHECRAESP